MTDDEIRAEVTRLEDALDLWTVINSPEGMERANERLGFNHEGVTIVMPSRDDSLRSSVDPMATYGREKVLEWIVWAQAWEAAVEEVK